MENFKHLLVIAYYFPPLGGAGVQRVVKFVKYLYEFGWIAHVVTVGKSSLYPLQDETFLKELPPGVTIDYVDDPYDVIARKIAKFSPIQKLVDKIRKKKVNLAAAIRYRLLSSPWFAIPDDAHSWINPAFQVACDLIKRYEIKVIFSTSAPFSTHLLGYKIKKAFNVSWVADFRDEWTQNNYNAYPTRFHKRANQRWESRVLKEADLVIGISEPLTEILYKTLNENQGKFITITNGYDPEDFVQSDEVQPTLVAGKQEKFVFSYAGAFYGLRTPKYFLMAIEQMLLEGEIEDKDIQIKFWGEVKKLDLSSPRINALIDCKGYLTHRESIAEICRTDALLLLMPTAGGNRVYPGKLFEYLASNRPILALVPQGVAADLILQCGAGIVVAPEDVEGIKNGIREFLRRWRADEKILPDQTIINHYDRRYLTGVLAKQLDLMMEKMGI